MKSAINLLILLSATVALGDQSEKVRYSLIRFNHPGVCKSNRGKSDRGIETLSARLHLLRLAGSFSSADRSIRA